MLKCDSCLENTADNFFSRKLRCGHVYCAVCKYHRRDLIRNNICVICKANQKNTSKYWINLRSEFICYKIE